MFHILLNILREILLDTSLREIITTTTLAALKYFFSVRSYSANVHCVDEDQNNFEIYAINFQI